MSEHQIKRWTLTYPCDGDPTMAVVTDGKVASMILIDLTWERGISGLYHRRVGRMVATKPVPDYVLRETARLARLFNAQRGRVSA